MSTRLFKRKVFFWVTMFVAIWANVSGQSQNLIGDRVVAIAGKNIFTERDLDLWVAEIRLSSPTYSNVPQEKIRQYAFPAMIDHFLLAGWAEQEITPPPREVVETTTLERLQTLEEIAGGQAAMETLLYHHQIEPDLFRLWLKDKIEDEMMIRDTLVAFTDLGGRDPLNKKIEQATQIQLAHILIPFSSRSSEDQAETMSEALKIRKNLVNGLSIDQVIQLYNSGKKNHVKGGTLGWFEQKELQKDIWEAALSVPVGTPTEPILGKAGYQLFLVEDFETTESLEYQQLIKKAEKTQLARLRKEVGVQVGEGYTLKVTEKEQ